MPYDVEDLKRMIESPGWKAYVMAMEDLIQSQISRIDLCNTLEDFQKVKMTVKAYQTAIDYPLTLIEREDSPA